MTLPQKKLRKIEVDGKVYGWMIRSRPTWSQGLGGRMTLAIQELELETPTILRVTLNILRPDNWLEQKHNMAITPEIIRDIIDAALQEGWKSKEGSAFDFDYHIANAE